MTLPHAPRNSSRPLPALFLDRDGVIIENRAGYVRDWSDVEIFPQAISALTSIVQWPGKIIIVTNQSVVGRGIITIEQARAINRQLVQLIHTRGGRIDAVYMCPHAPVDNCSCRKPQPGLLLQAAHDRNLDLPNSLMIGDALTDLAAGRAASVSRVALLQTGRGRHQQQLPGAASLRPFPVYATLADALKQLLASQNSTTP